MIGPESISVPSRSKRTTGKRMSPIVARRLPTGVRVSSVSPAVRPSYSTRSSRAPSGGAVAPASAPRPALQQRPKRLGVRLEHRPDERPHHVAQERVGGDREVELVAAALPGRLADVAHEDLVLRLGGCEGREVVLADERPRRMPGAPRGRAAAATRAPARPAAARARGGSARRSDTSVPSRRSARGSRPAPASASTTATSSGSAVVERLREPLDRRAALGVEARDLSRGVDAGVGAPCDGETVPAGRRRRAPRAARLRPSAGPADAPSPGTRCRRTRGSGDSVDHGACTRRVTSAARPRARGRRDR